jgi:hypothetical protein
MTVFKRIVLAGVCGLALSLSVVAVAQAAPEDPIFIYTPIYKPPNPPPNPPPPPIPPPTGSFEGPCGIAVNEEGDFYLSDYYHRVVDLFGPGHEYITQLAGLDPLDGPCGLATDDFANLYVNDFHRNVTRYGIGPFDAGTVIDGAPLNDERPTGVAANQFSGDVYVDERDRIGVFDASGTRLGTIGEGSLGDGYGLAYSEGRIYVPDAATDTVKVYEASAGETDPVATIDGSGTPKGHFTSLRDAAIAVDDASGEIYVADDLQPQYTERPETVVYVFSSTGNYEGRLKYSVAGGLPVGLAVDNSFESTQGRVYVTSGNTELGAVYAYPPGAVTNNAVPLPAPPPGAGVGGGAGSGSGASGLTPPPAPEAAAALAPATSLGTPVSKTKRSQRHKSKRHHRKTSNR